MMQQHIGEVELLEASVAGDRDAFGTIVERYQSLVCAITYSVTGSIECSEELAHETFIRAWRNLRQLEDPGKFRAWLCTIARNLANTSLRAGRRGAPRPLARAAGLSAAGAGPDDAALTKERQEIVWAAVERVPLQYREPLVLFYREQQSVSQVAADLELSEDTVRQRLHRGRQLIKAEVSSLVEDTLVRSGPGKTFAVAVIAALPALITPPASAAVAGIVAKSTKGVSAAKTVFAGGLSGAVLGPIIGIMGGIFGAWCSIKSTRSPRERRFMIRMTVLLWVLLCGLVGVPLVLMLTKVVPAWFYWTCFTVFFCILIPLIFWGNRQQQQIQVEDSTVVLPPGAYAPPRGRALYASFGGAMFGSTLWLMILAGITHDWTALLAVLGGAAGLLFLTVRIAARPRRYWTAARVALAGVAVLTFGAVNLRWQHWMHAYGRSELYNPINDVSLTTINLIIAGAFLLAFIMLILTTRHRRRAVRPSE